jgi:putative heme transporter
VLGLIAWFVTDQVSAQYSDLVDQLSASLHRLRNGLVGGPLHAQARGVDNLQATVTKWLNSHRGTIASGVVTGVSVVSETLIGVVLALFTTFFMLYDGERIWGFCAGLLPASGRRRATVAAGSAWLRISGFVRGTFLIAVFHGVVMGVGLAVMRVPLAVPLALLVFLGSFIPIVGVVVFGGLAVLVTFGTKGLALALVLLGILLIANQVESHLLQPFLVGRYVHLHPLAVALAITAGGLIGGIVGAILAVPVTSAVDAVVRSLAADPADAAA